MYEGRTLTPEEEAAFAKEKALDAEIDEINRELQKTESSPFVKGSTAKKVDLSSIVGAINTEAAKEEIFLTPMNIKMHERNMNLVIPSGINMLDKRIMGFNKGELSVWSGSNGCGKSSLLSQLAIECIDTGRKVALYSGELRADRVMNWIHLQCAGKQNIISTQYQNYYTVPAAIRNKINQWLEGKLYVYNNAYSSKVEVIVEAVKRCIEQQNIDVIIIDNLMSLDLTSVTGEKYEKQSNLVIALTALCKSKNVVIHFITHPRKTMMFLRKNDISGTADITNAADNVFLVHRCNTDFRKGIKEHLSIKDDHPLLGYDNVIEVCKNRDLGISDEFIGMYFEKETKRFMNYSTECKRYGWEKSKDGFLQLNTDEVNPFGNAGD